VDAPDLVVVGHLTHDRIVRGSQEDACMGGVPAHFGLTVAALGLSTGVVTTVGPDLDPDHLRVLHAAGIDLTGVRIGQSPTTTFVNIYEAGQRVQECPAVADGIGPDDVPAAYEKARAVHLGPLMGEIDPAVVDRFPHARISLDVQGLVRRRKGRQVLSKALDRDTLPRRLDVIKLGEDELELATGTTDVVEGSERAVELGASMSIVTMGVHGSHVYDGRHHDIPAFPVEEVDPTGAGDAYMAGFLDALLADRDVPECGRFAAACGALCVTSVGSGFAHSRKEVERLAWGT
jgi:sugar/nucleoside kinase (ribokinase family)